MSDKKPEWKYYYERAKALHICYQCGKQDAYTIIGKTLCADCMNKRVKANRESREKNRKTIQQRNHDRTIELKQKCICIVCRHRKAEVGHTKCKHCINQQVTRDKKRRLKNGKLSAAEANYLGLCTMCRVNTPIQGKKLCPKCYAICCENLKKANIVRDERNMNRNHYWRGLNNLLFKGAEAK